MTRSIWILACALAGALSTSPAAAQEHTLRLDDAYWAVKLQLGFGGSVSTSTDAGSATVSADRSAQVSFGLAGQYMVPLHRYFVLGGQFGLLSWRSTRAGDSDDGGRNLLFDLAAVPQGRYPLLRNLELYGALPIGLALNMLNEVNSNNTIFIPAIGSGGGASADGGSALGFVFGFLVGVRYQLLDSLGLQGELGYMYRTFSHSVETTIGALGVSTSVERDVSVSFGQFVLNLGAYF